jgi:D-serine dehydratase
MHLDPLGSFLLDRKIKGMPGEIEPFSLSKIGEKRWNLLREDLSLPLAVLKESALAHNGTWMRRFLRLSGAVIAPHGKTTMSPQLFARQLADGAWGITVATAQQLQVARDFGVQRVVLANQLVGRQAIRYVISELRRDRGFDFYCLVDSEDNVTALAAAARDAELERPIQVLLEGGYAGGRTGCRDLASALAVARSIKSAEPFVALRGVEGFEGLFAGTTDQKEAEVAWFLDFLVETAISIARQGLFAPGPIILSAGGSAFYDMVVASFRDAGVDREFMVLTRSGCYLTHDSGMYREAFDALRERSPQAESLGSGLIAALEVWAYVQSRPEPTKILLTMGKRDVSYDDMPIALTWARPGEGRLRSMPEAHLVIGLNDQHCHMSVPPDSPLRIGDMVGFGISHPCLTFDKWQVICLVDDDYTITSAIRTFF